MPHAACSEQQAASSEKQQQLMRLAKWITAICFVAQTANRMAQCGMKLLAAATLFSTFPCYEMHKVQEGREGERGEGAQCRVELLLTPKVYAASLYTYA